MKGPDPLIHAIGLLSFNNLVEAHILRSLRTKQGVQLDAVRRSVRYAEDQLGKPHFLRRNEWETDGKDIFLDHLCGLLTLSLSGQYALRGILDEHIDRVRYHHDKLPLKLYPFVPRRSARIIEIDPSISFGKPTVLGTGVSTTILVHRINVGEGVAAVARDYGLDEGQVRDAMHYEHAA